MDVMVCRICNSFVHCEECAWEHQDWHTEASLARYSQEMAERTKKDEALKKHLESGLERNAFNVHAAELNATRGRKHLFTVTGVEQETTPLVAVGPAAGVDPTAGGALDPLTPLAC